MTVGLPDFAQGLGLALGLGLLVGLQRERSGQTFAGLRTFALVSLLGATAALLSTHFGAAIVVAGFVGTMVLVVMGNLALEPGDSGMTTEAALLLVYSVGVLAGMDLYLPATVVGGACGVLLHMKARLHAMAQRLTEKDSKAIWQFVLLTLVVLPFLPNREMGPYGVLNPRNVWWMVILIVSVSLAGYLAFRLKGPNAGLALGGLIGGLISSTATTFAYSKRVRNAPHTARSATLGLLIAYLVSFVRVIAELAIVTPQNCLRLGLPIGLLVVGNAAACAWFFRHITEGEIDAKEPSNPTEIGSAIAFGALYALVLVAISAANETLGDGGLYAVAVLAGFTDMDAIALSTARLVDQGSLEVDTGARVLLAAATGNLSFKLALVSALAGTKLLRPLGLATVPIFVAAGLIFSFL